MIGLDTNVLLRYAIRDDMRQTQRADALIDALTPDDPGLVTHIVLVELWWVLTRSYHMTPQRTAAFIDKLLDVKTIHTQDADLVTEALSAVIDKHADFADALIVAIATAQGCAQVKTFDAKAVARAGMTAIDDSDN